MHQYMYYNIFFQVAMNEIALHNGASDEFSFSPDANSLLVEVVVVDPQSCSWAVLCDSLKNCLKVENNQQK